MSSKLWPLSRKKKPLQKSSSLTQEALKVIEELEKGLEGLRQQEEQCDHDSKHTFMKASLEGKREMQEEYFQDVIKIAERASHLQNRIATLEKRKQDALRMVSSSSSSSSTLEANVPDQHQTSMVAFAINIMTQKAAQQVSSVPRPATLSTLYALVSQLYDKQLQTKGGWISQSMLEVLKKQRGFDERETSICLFLNTTRMLRNQLAEREGKVIDLVHQIVALQNHTNAVAGFSIASINNTADATTLYQQLQAEIASRDHLRRQLLKQLEPLAFNFEQDSEKGVETQAEEKIEGNKECGGSSHHEQLSYSVQAYLSFLKEAQDQCIALLKSLNIDGNSIDDDPFIFFQLLISSNTIQSEHYTDLLSTVKMARANGSNTPTNTQLSHLGWKCVVDHLFEKLDTWWDNLEELTKVEMGQLEMKMGSVSSQLRHCASNFDRLMQTVMLKHANRNDDPMLTEDLVGCIKDAGAAAVRLKLKLDNAPSMDPESSVLGLIACAKFFESEMHRFEDYREELLTLSRLKPPLLCVNRLESAVHSLQSHPQNFRRTIYYQGANDNSNVYNSNDNIDDKDDDEDEEEDEEDDVWMDALSHGPQSDISHPDHHYQNDDVVFRSIAALSKSRQVLLREQSRHSQTSSTSSNGSCLSPTFSPTKSLLDHLSCHPLGNHESDGGILSACLPVFPELLIPCTPRFLFYQGISFGLQVDSLLQFDGDFGNNTEFLNVRQKETSDRYLFRRVETNSQVQPHNGFASSDANNNNKEKVNMETVTDDINNVDPSKPHLLYFLYQHCQNINLLRHNHILPLYAVLQHPTRDNVMYLQHPYMQLGSLAEWWPSQRGIAEDSVCRQICIGILRGLDYLHTSGLPHGYLTPSCIFMKDASTPMLGGTMIHKSARGKFEDNNKEAQLFLSPEVRLGEVQLTPSESTDPNVNLDISERQRLKAIKKKLKQDKKLEKKQKKEEKKLRKRSRTLTLTQFTRSASSSPSRHNSASSTASENGSLSDALSAFRKKSSIPASSSMSNVSFGPSLRSMSLSEWRKEGNDSSFIEEKLDTTVTNSTLHSIPLDIIPIELSDLYSAGAVVAWMLLEPQTFSSIVSDPVVSAKSLDAINFGLKEHAYAQMKACAISFLQANPWKRFSARRALHLHFMLEKHFNVAESSSSTILNQEGVLSREDAYPIRQTPLHWLKATSCSVQPQLSEVTNALATNVSSLLHHSLLAGNDDSDDSNDSNDGRSIHVHHVFQVENPLLWDLYLKQRNKIAQEVDDCGSSLYHILFDETQFDIDSREIFASHSHHSLMTHEAGERFMFFPILKEHAFSIATRGFENVHISHDRFGKGLYFSDTPKTAIEALGEHGDASSYCLLVCRVSLGHSHIENHSCRDLRAPPMNFSSGMPYNSITGTCTLIGCKHFVVFNRYQCYPEFLIEFDIQDSSTAA